MENNHLQFDIYDALCGFARWLGKDPDDYKFSFVDLPNEGLMRYEPKERRVIFNLHLYRYCNWDYFQTTLYHEFYHVLGHHMCNIIDVKVIRDAFNDTTIRFMDVEADLVTAQYLKEVKGYSFERFVNALYQGQKVFSDPVSRAGKLERFIGTICSVRALYEKEQKIVHVPSISLLPTEGYILFLVSRPSSFWHGHIYLASEELFGDILEAFRGDYCDHVEFYMEAVDKFTKAILQELDIAQNGFPLTLAS